MDVIESTEGSLYTGQSAKAYLKEAIFELKYHKCMKEDDYSKHNDLEVKMRVCLKKQKGQYY